MGKTYQIRLTETAEADLAELWAYLATEASDAVATTFLTALTGDLDRLSQAPYAGPARDTLAPELRVIFHARYAIYYRVLADTVVIVRVLHGARDMRLIADKGGFE